MRNARNAFTLPHDIKTMRPAIERKIIKKAIRKKDI